MNCPTCDAEMIDVTESWPTYPEAEGAEYLASYVSIWRCSVCETVVGAGGTEIEWVMEREGAVNE